MPIFFKESNYAYKQQCYLFITNVIKINAGVDDLYYSLFYIKIS